MFWFARLSNSSCLRIPIVTPNILGCEGFVQNPSATERRPTNRSSSFRHRSRDRISFSAPYNFHIFKIICLDTASMRRKTASSETCRYSSSQRMPQYIHVTVLGQGRSSRSTTVSDPSLELLTSSPTRPSDFIASERY